MSKRTDIHCPSKIVPGDYEYVAITYFGGMGRVNIDDIPFVQEERKRLKDHMDRTNGKYSKHEHGGTCHCCGAHAIYMIAFYHSKNNEYIKVGQICAEKLDMSFDENESNLFRKRVREALKIAKGKKRAQEMLKELGIDQTWGIYEAGVATDTKYEERIIVDMVQKLIRYANLSDKQTSFLTALLDKVNNRAEVERQRAAERANAAECPNGRLKFKGVVISIKEQDGFYGHEIKMLVKSETGFLAFGSIPRNLRDVSRGQQVEFEANFTQSKKDTKFGYFKRPTKGKILGAISQTDLEEILSEASY